MINKNLHDSHKFYLLCFKNDQQVNQVLGSFPKGAWVILEGYLLGKPTVCARNRKSPRYLPL